jgi:hypothetical protein
MRRIRLTESQLHRVIKKSVKKVLRENSYDVQNGKVCYFDITILAWPIDGNATEVIPDNLLKQYPCDVDEGHNIIYKFRSYMEKHPLSQEEMEKEIEAFGLNPDKYNDLSICLGFSMYIDGHKQFHTSENINFRPDWEDIFINFYQ